MLSKHTILSVAPTRDKTKKRRRNEFLLGGALFLLVIFLTTVTLSLVGVDSVLFVVLLNINILLLMLVLFVVVRNGIKLLIERRRGVLGSRLRTKLVVTFMLLSLIPTTMMFIASTKAVQSAVDYWFRSRTESYLQMALGVGTQYVDGISNFLRQQGFAIANTALTHKIDPVSEKMAKLLDSRRAELNFALSGVLLADGNLLHWEGAEDALTAWNEVKSRVVWTEASTFNSIFQQGQDADYAFGLEPLPKGSSEIDAGYIVLAFRLEQGTLYRLDRLARGSSEYRDLKELKNPFKTTFYFFLALIALIITLGAMWVGFRLAKELTQPLMALMEGTERISKGDLSIRFDDKGTDEIGLLIQSFNRMTEDLEQSDKRIRSINDDLSLSNEKLAERSRYIETVLNSVAAGVISLNKEERISTVNKAACLIFNLRRENFLGKHPTELLKGQQGEFIAQLLAQIRKTPGVKHQRQMTVDLGDKEWKLLITGTALVGADGEFNGAVAIFEDITDLEKAQRMAAWREVARRIAHEIKNPLTPIKLSAQRLERKFGPEVNSPTFTQCTELIVRQVEQLQQMVEEFSAFAKLPEVSLKRGQLRPLLEELVLLFRNSHSNIQWNLNIESDLPDLNMDYASLYRAFLNILTNAAEALQGCENPEVQINVAFKPEQNVIQIDFADNGPGLSSEELLRLFEPYFSQKKDGTGLGLTIVKSIVSDHHGYVRAKSEDGAVVTVELPTDATN